MRQPGEIAAGVTVATAALKPAGHHQQCMELAATAKIYGCSVKTYSLGFLFTPVLAHVYP